MGEQQQLGVELEKLGRQLDAVEHPSALQIPATFSSTAFPLLLLSFSCHSQKGCVKRQNGFSFSKPSEKA